MRVDTSLVARSIMDTTTPAERGHPPRTHLVRAECGNPDAVGVAAHRRRTVRNVTPQRERMLREAKASRRKAGGMHNPLDRAIPDPKGY